MKTLKDLKNELLADGKIDAAEVQELQKILYADGKIDKDEADFLFDLNDAVSESENDPSWETFFVQAISDFLLKDEVSSGEIDDNETAWLIEKIGNDGKVDNIEKALLLYLQENAKSFPKELEAIL